MRNAKSAKSKLIDPAIPIAFALLATCSLLSLLDHVGKPVGSSVDYWAISISVSAIISCLFVPTLLYYRVWRSASKPELAKV